MIEHVKLRARALQQQHRALFAAVFWFRAAGTALLLVGAAAGAFFLRGFWRAMVPASCGLAAVLFCGACSLGEELCCSALAKGGEARFRTFLSAFCGKALFRSCASVLLSGAVQSVFGLLLCFPGVLCAGLLLCSLHKGLPVQAAIFLVLGTAALLSAAVWARFCVRAVFLPRVCYLANGSGVWRSVKNCLFAETEDYRCFLRLQRSFYGWRLLSLLPVSLPFVQGYFAQSRAVLFSVMNLHAMA